MPLDVGQLSKALVSAFPSWSKLELLAARAGQELSLISPEAVAAPNVSLNLAKEAQANGWLDRLFHAALDLAPGNQELLSLALGAGFPLKQNADVLFLSGADDRNDFVTETLKNLGIDLDRSVTAAGNLSCFKSDWNRQILATPSNADFCVVIPPLDANSDVILREFLRAHPRSTEERRVVIATHDDDLVSQLPAVLETSTVFYVKDLAAKGDLRARLLRMIKRKLEGIRLDDPYRPGAPGMELYGKTVTFGPVSQIRQSAVATLRRNLESKGVRVLPEEATRYPTDFKASLEADLNQSQLFVQLLTPEAEQASTAPLAHLDWVWPIMKDRVLLWRPQGGSTPSSDEGQASLAIFKRPDVKSLSLIDLETCILQSLKAKPTIPPEGREGFGGYVFIDFDDADREHAKEKIYVTLNSLRFGYPDATVRGDDVDGWLTESLQDCKAAILVYGNAPAQWVRGRLKKCLNILAKSTSTMPSLAVYQSLPPDPPSVKPPLGFNLDSLKILDCRTEDLQLEEFLKCL